MSERRSSGSLPTLSGPQLAALIGLSGRQVQRLAAEGVLPRDGRGRYDPTKAVPAFVQYLRDGREGSGSLVEEKLRLTVAQRREIEQKTRHRARELVEIDEVDRVFAAAMVTVGSQLDGLGGRLANELSALTDPAQVREVLFRETRRIRAAAAAQLEALAGAPASGEPAEAAEGGDGG
jgi:phage terminase Nu1 subunit (DNA packaging protein)